MNKINEEKSTKGKSFMGKWHIVQCVCVLFVCAKIKIIKYAVVKCFHFSLLCVHTLFMLPPHHIIIFTSKFLIKFKLCLKLAAALFVLFYTIIYTVSVHTSQSLTQVWMCVCFFAELNCYSLWGGIGNLRHCCGVMCLL